MADPPRDAHGPISGGRLGGSDSAPEKVTHFVTQQATARRDPDSHQTRQPREKRISLGAERYSGTPTGKRRNPVFCEKTDTAERRRCRIRCSWTRNRRTDQPVGFPNASPEGPLAGHRPGQGLAPCQSVSLSAQPCSCRDWRRCADGDEDGPAHGHGDHRHC